MYFCMYIFIYSSHEYLCTGCFRTEIPKVNKLKLTLFILENNNIIECCI